MSDDLITALSIARQFVPNGTEAAERVDTAMRAALEAQIAAVAPAVDAQPVAVYQVQTGDCWLDMTKEQFDNHSKSRPTRILYASAQSEGLRKDALDALRAAEDALESCYDVTEFPWSGKSKQDVALETVRAALSQHTGEKDD